MNVLEQPTRPAGIREEKARIRAVFSTNLAAEIRSQKIAVTELARRTGISRDRINRYAFTAESTPSADVVMALADGLGVAPDQLLPGFRAPAREAMHEASTRIDQLEDGTYWIEVSRRLSARRLQKLMAILADQDDEDAAPAA